MRATTLLIAILAAPVVHADQMIGTANLTYIETTEYQPGSCATRGSEETSACIDMYYWMRYRLENLRDLKSRRMGRATAVMATHLPRKGHWLVVLEKLSEEEARRFDADFRIVDGGRAFQVACLSEPVQKHVADSKAEAYTDKEGERFCYDIEDLHDED